MTLRQTLADNLAALMGRTPGLSTQMQVAHSSGIAQTTISRILRGATSVTLDHIEQLAAAFGIPPGDLLSGSKETNRRPAASGGKLSAAEWTEVERFVAQTLARRHGARTSFANRTPAREHPSKHDEQRRRVPAKKRRAA